MKVPAKITAIAFEIEVQRLRLARMTEARANVALADRHYHQRLTALVSKNRIKVVSDGRDGWLFTGFGGPVPFLEQGPAYDRFPGQFDRCDPLDLTRVDTQATAYAHEVTKQSHGTRQVSPETGLLSMQAA